MKRVLSEKTLLPVSFVLTIAAGVYAFGRVSFATEENREDLNALTQSLKEIQTSVLVDLRDQSASLSDMRIQVLLMDAKLNEISQQLKKKR